VDVYLDPKDRAVTVTSPWQAPPHDNDPAPDLFLDNGQPVWRKWKCSDLTDHAFLLTVWNLQRKESDLTHLLYSTLEPNLATMLAGLAGYGRRQHRMVPTSDIIAMYDDMIPAKVIHRKAARLYWRDLLSGCPCGCRGDWCLTKQGAELIGVKWTAEAEALA
jgi:hypothetical protein